MKHACFKDHPQLLLLQALFVRYIPGTSTRYGATQYPGTKIIHVFQLSRPFPYRATLKITRGSHNILSGQRRNFHYVGRWVYGNVSPRSFRSHNFTPPTQFSTYHLQTIYIQIMYISATSIDHSHVMICVAQFMLPGGIRRIRMIYLARVSWAGSALLLLQQILHNPFTTVD